MAPNIGRTASHEAWNTPAEYPSWECKYNTRDFHTSYYYSYVTWASWWGNSPPAQFFVQQVVQVNNKENSKLCIRSALWGESSVTSWFPSPMIIKVANDSMSWWRHQMEAFSMLLAICEGNSPVTSEFPSQRPVTQMFCLICTWKNSWVNNHEAGDLRHQCTHYDIIIMLWHHHEMLYNLFY